MMRLVLFAAGIFSLTVVSAWAFSQQIVSPDGGNYQFSDPDKKLTAPDNHNSGQSTQSFGNGFSVQFSAQQAPARAIVTVLLTPIFDRLITATENLVTQRDSR